MALKKYCIIALVSIMVMVLSVGSTVAVADNGSSLPSDSMDYGEYTRTWRYYVPTSYNGSEPVPLVFSFHGLGSSGAGQEDLTSFANLAEEEGFIVVFPDATNIPGTHPILPLLPGNTIQWNLGGPGSYNITMMLMIWDLLRSWLTCLRAHITLMQVESTPRGCPTALCLHTMWLCCCRARSQASQRLLHR